MVKRSLCGWRQSAGFDQEGSPPSSRFVLDKYASATVLLPEKNHGRNRRVTTVVSKRQMASVLRRRNRRGSG